MAPSKKQAAAAAAAAPMSALAARKAREQAQASTSTQHQPASATRSPRRSSSLRNGPVAEGEGEGEDLSVEVVLPLPTASQAAASRPNTRSSHPSPSSLKRPRRSSVTQDPTSIAATRPRRNSSAASTKPSVSTPKSTKASPARAAQSTPSRSSARNTPSSNNKGKARSVSAAADDVDDDDEDLKRDLEKILADFTGQAETSDDEALEPEQPPRKKRAKQVSSLETPSKPRRQSTSRPEPSSVPKRSPAKPAPQASTPPKKAAAKRASAAKISTEEPNSAKPKAGNKQPAKEQLTADEKRIREAKRYFAATARKQGKTHVGPSAMPVEDEATGFLAFGQDDDEEEGEEAVDAGQDDQQEGEDMKVDSGSDDSSEDDEPQNEQSENNSSQKHISSSVNGGQNGSNRAGKRGEAPSRFQSSKIVLDHDEDEEEGQDGDSAHAEPSMRALSRQALLDAVPYSRFVPVLEGKAKNVHLVENKRKRGKEALFFGLRAGDTLVFLGIGRLEVLRGSVQVGGAVVSSSSDGFGATDIYAPISNPLPVLKSVSASRYPGLAACDTRSESDVDAMFDSVFDTVVKVMPLSSPITALGQVCPIGGLATLFSMPPSLELSNEVHQLSTIKVLLEPSIDDVIQKQKQRNLPANGIIPTVGLTATYIPHKWQNALHRLSASALSAAQHPQEESVVALIRGNKKVGKSTLSRTALERLLSMGKVIGGKVAYIELDLGQSDFGPPGMVALHVLNLTDHVQSETVDEEAHAIDAVGALSHEVQEAQELAQELESEVAPQGNSPRAPRSCVTIGPGWCQPRVPVRAHFIGDVSPRDDPEGYVAAVHDLIEFFRAQIQPGQPNENGESQRVPLVINTQGWIKGLGADLAARIEPLVRPTHIFDVIPRGSPDPVPPPTRGQPWLDAEGAILGSGPEIVFLESVSQLEFGQNSFGLQRHSNADGSSQRDFTQSNGTLTAKDDKNEAGDGGSAPPRYITEVGSKLAPAEARLLNVMSYLYATQLAPAVPSNAFKTQGTWDFSQPLVHRPPLVVDVRQGLRAGIRVLALGSSVPDNQKLMALNSSIVAIIVTDQSNPTQAPEENVAAQTQPDASKTWKQAFDRAIRIAQPGAGLSSSCVGLGIARSIDALSGHVHLITPLDPAFLHQVQTDTGADIGLVKGALELPVWASLDFDAIKEARESRLDVPSAVTYTPPASLSDDAASNGVEGQQPSQPAQKLLAGMPRNQVPYLEWPHSAMMASRQKGKHMASNGNSTSSNAGPSAPIPLGSERRRIRRNLMRKSQFA